LQVQKTKPGYKLVKSYFGKYEEIPEDWIYEKLENTGDFINGLNKEREDYGHGCLHVNIDNIFESFSIDSNKLGRVNATIGEIERYRLEKGDLCLLRSSVKREGVGYPALFDGSNYPVVFSGFIIRFRPRTNFWNPRYLTYLLRVQFVRNFVLSRSTSSANTNINQKSYGSILLYVPPIKTQQKIALVLSNVDDSIQKTLEQIEKTKQLKIGLMQQLFTKGIGHKKFKEIYLHPKSISYLVPEDWEIKHLNEICKIIDTPHYTSPTQKFGIPVITTSDCNSDGKIDYSNVKFTSEEEYEKRIETINPKVGEVLFTREAPLGIAVIIDNEKISIGQRIVLLKHNQNKIGGEFFTSFLNSYYGKLQSTSYSIRTTVDRINISDIKKIRIPVPTILEQEKMVRIFSDVNSQIQELEKNKSSLENCKKGLMQKLLTGQIRVKTQ